jgi:hypothetical protein
MLSLLRGAKAPRGNLMSGDKSPAQFVEALRADNASPLERTFMN